MKRCFINEMSCVSGQDTLSDNFLVHPIDYSMNHLIYTKKPNYKNYIPAGSIRRMGKGVKNGIVASTEALKDFDVKKLDGIIVGTGLGCINDSEKFVEKMIRFDEEYLTPTSFIQSTHNTVAGSIALRLKCNAYNFTYVNSGSSFQSALLDGWMKIKTGEGHHFLIGGVDEIGEYTPKFYQTINYKKGSEEQPFSVLGKRSKGMVSGEAASFFTIGNEQNTNTYAAISAVSFVNKVKVEETQGFIQSFLHKKELNTKNIDAILLGNNGDVDFDIYYDEAEKLFPNAEKLYFKHLFGDFFTSPAVATWIGANILKRQEIPTALFKGQEKKTERKIRNVLIYTQLRGRDQSLILLENV